MKILILLAFVFQFLAMGANAQVLKPGDPVTIELKAPVEDAAVVSTRYTISDSGTLKMPHLDAEIQAAGLTAPTLARKIEAAYKSAEIYTNPTIVAQLTTPEQQAPHVVNVAGEVRTGGGTIPLRTGMRLLSALTACGGFTEYAKTKNVRLIRGTKETVYDMRKIDANGANNPVLQDGDSIIVPQD